MKCNNGKINTTRSEFKNVKKMDHQQLDAFLQRVYEKGSGLANLEHERGILKGMEISKKEFFNAMQQVKGIGEKRRMEIMELYKKTIEEKVGEKDASSKDLY